MKPFLSLCMIVKNEEKVLDRCLNSVQGIVDEIIIMDTGSTDETKKIAYKYTEEIYDLEWQEDFSAARNLAASKATGEWILVLDADEYVERSNLAEMKKELKNNKKSIEIYNVKIVNFLGVEGERTAHHRHERIYKNNGDIKYYRSIHEQLTNNNSQSLSSLSSLVIYHSGYLQQIVNEKNKRERNKPLVEKEIKISSHKGFDFFNLGNEVDKNKNPEKALNLYTQAYKLKPDFNFNWVPNCLLQIANCLFVLKRYEEAILIIEDATDIYQKAADFLYLKAEIYYAQKRFDDALEVYLMIKEHSDNYTENVISSDCVEYLPNVRLGSIYEYEKEYEKAVKYYALALSTNKRCNISLNGLLRILSLFHTEKDLFLFLKNKNLLTHDTSLQFVLHFALNKGLTNLSQLIIKEFYIEDILLNSYQYKINLIKDKFIVSNSFEIFISNIQAGVLDNIDWLLFNLRRRESNFIDKEDYDISNIFDFVFLNTELNEKNYNMYLLLIQRAIDYKIIDLADELIEKTNIIGSQIFPSLANVLYQSGFENLALSYYQLSDEIHLKETDFVNIINWLIANNNFEEALRLAQLANVKYKDNFIFYKYIILLSDDKEAYILNSMEIFKKSNWLEKELFKLI